MFHFTATTRIELPRSRIALAAIACGVACVVHTGCHNGSERDLVARELRMQEDQLYAMEEYLTEYQSLLRQARAENRQLKCQLADQNGELPEPAPGSSGAVTPRESPSTAPRSTDPPAEPDTNGSPGVSPPTEIEVPDIPPLEETTSTETPHDGVAIVPEIVDDEEYGEPRILQASAEIDAPNEETAVEESASSDLVVCAETEPPAPESAEEPQDSAPPAHVWLHGDVVANPSGGGPRLVVDVEPLNVAGRSTTFIGSLSLMILAPTDGGRPHSLARWDFTHADLQAVAADSPEEGAFRFFLELPADAPTEVSLQLWARMLPESGEKILAHANLNVAELSHFSSVLDKRLRKGPSEGVAIKDRDAEIKVVSRKAGKRRQNAPVDINDGSWTVALPGKPRNLAERDEQPRGAWRTASEPIPIAREAIPTPTPNRYAALPHQVEQADYLVEASTKPERKFALPTWSPDRSGNSPDVTVTDDEPHAAALPSWSPDR